MFFPHGSSHFSLWLFHCSSCSGPNPGSHLDLLSFSQALYPTHRQSSSALPSSPVQNAVTFHCLYHYHWVQVNIMCLPWWLQKPFLISLLLLWPPQSTFSHSCQSALLNVLVILCRTPDLDPLKDSYLPESQGVSLYKGLQSPTWTALPLPHCPHFLPLPCSCSLCSTRGASSLMLARTSAHLPQGL